MSARFTPPTYEAIPSVDQMVTSMDRTVSGLEQIKRRLALALRRFMVAAAKDHDRPPQNIIVIGPSGGGKTFLLRQLLSSIPVIWTDVDATAFSDVGYVGRDLSSMYLGLMSPKWRGARGQAEPPYLSPEMVSLASRWGVMVLDEADKLRAPARPKEGERQVGRALQAELLKLVEGVDTMVKRTDDERGVMLPTHNILHIAVGAFQGLDSIVSKDLVREGISPPPAAYQKATIFNIIEYGFLEELVGRFSTILTLPPLDSGSMARILREHVIPDFERQCADDGITLIVDEGAIHAASSKAAGLPIGARALAPMIDDCLAKQWGEAQRGDQLKLTAEGIKTDTCLLVRPVAA
jgi:ATP-dependent Clp protease ATP-binding subunit ClpX